MCAHAHAHANGHQEGLSPKPLEICLSVAQMNISGQETAAAVHVAVAGVRSGVTQSG